MKTAVIVEDMYVSCEYWPGIALVVVGESCEETWDWDEYLGYYDCDYVRKPGFWDCVMVGDGEVHQIDEFYLRPLEDDQFCHGCGQIGCKWH